MSSRLYLSAKQMKCSLWPVAMARALIVFVPEMAFQLLTPKEASRMSPLGS